MLNTYCAAWPDELKEAHRELYRAVCKRRCLEAAITRINPSEFDETMSALETAVSEVLKCGYKVQQLEHDYNELLAQRNHVGKCQGEK